MVTMSVTDGLVCVPDEGNESHTGDVDRASDGGGAVQAYLLRWPAPPWRPKERRLPAQRAAAIELHRKVTQCVQTVDPSSNRCAARRTPYLWMAARATKGPPVAFGEQGPGMGRERSG